MCILLTMCLLYYGKSRAQSQTWVVRDGVTWEVLEGVQVLQISSAADTVLVTSTDSLGRFRLTPRGVSPEKLLLQKKGYLPRQVNWSSDKRLTDLILMEPRVFEADEVILSANRFASDARNIPQQVNVIRRKLVETDNPSSSATMLEQAGIFIQRSQAGGGSPVLRGFEANRILLVVDGVRMNNAIYRSGHLQNVLTIDPDLLERTEVLFGPASVMYGSDALGGVLHFYSRTPRLSQTRQMMVKMHGYLRTGTASDERSIHYDVNIGGKKWAAISSLSWRDFGDLRVGRNRSTAYADWGKRDSLIVRQDGIDQIVANEDPNVMSPSGYGQLDIFQKWLFLPNESTSHSLNWQYSNSTDIPRFDRLTQVRGGRLTYAEWYYGPQERLLLSYRFQHEATQGPYDNVSIIAAWQEIEESRLNRRFQSEWLNQREEQVSVWSVNVDASKDFSARHKLTYGLEGYANEVRSSAVSTHIVNQDLRALDTRYPDGGTILWSAGAYISHQWSPYPKLSVIEGVRLSHISLRSEFIDKTFYPFPDNQLEQQNLAASGSIGFVWNGWDQKKISASVATGFRAPNLDDVAKVFDSQPGNVIVPNPDLLPERTYTLELGIEQEVWKGIRTGFTAWATWYDNAIVVRNVLINGQDSLLYEGVLSNVQANVNAKEAWLAGLSHVVQGKWDRMNIRHSLAWTYGQDISSGVPLDHIPPLHGSGEIGYRLEKLELGGRLGWQAWKRLDRFSPRDLNNAEFATKDGWPAWIRLDVLGTYRITEKMSVQSGVDNILDQHYRPFSSRISAPGRNIWITIRWSY